MSDPDVARHMELVRELSREVLHRASPHSTKRNPEWWRGDAPTPARQALHERITAELLEEAPAVEFSKLVLVMAGPPGAGKGSIRRHILGEDEEKFLVVDADKFKEKLLEAAVADGSFDAWIKPQEIRELEARGEVFYPLEFAALVHEESSYLATQLRDDEMERGTNIVIDTVLADPAKAVALGEQLEAAGYGVRVVDVEVSYEVSEARIRQRWEERYTEAVAGKDVLGGRWVPSTYAREVYAGPGCSSMPRESARRLAEECQAVTHYRVYFTSPEEAKKVKAVPTLEVNQARNMSDEVPRALRDVAPSKQSPARPTKPAAPAPPPRRALPTERSAGPERG
ncbi:zeta toxin family protein [Pseudoclavibacter helvolus]|uniref:zeta toxin family protein n=1 Tax=Pseudoclavibacter helvolus TaxID=255205 RepID=UPI003C793F94